MKRLCTLASIAFVFSGSGIAAPVLAQGPVPAKVTMSSEDFARNRASFVEGQTVEIQLCGAEGALMFKFDRIVQEGNSFPVDPRRWRGLVGMLME